MNTATALIAFPCVCTKCHAGIPAEHQQSRLTPTGAVRLDSMFGESLILLTIAMTILKRDGQGFNEVILHR